MCCGNGKGPKWKREVVKDHKFDFVDINEFYDPSCTARTSYIYMFFLILKGFLVYVADLWTAISLLVIGNSSINADASIPPDVAKWIFLGAIMISFILLFWDIRKARNIIASRDISYAFFSVIANRWYSTKSFKYFCLFRKINNSRKSIDSIAFFVFFTLKSWKKILLAEAPRQVINVVTLKTIIPKWIHISNGVLINNDGLGKNTIQRIMTGTMVFSTAIFAISFILLCAAAIIYIPVLCHIQGNLKEYCCHKVDKRIEEILRKQAKKRIEKNKTQKHRNNKKEDIEMQSLPQPTLPNIDINDNKFYNHHPIGPTYHQQQIPYTMMGSPFVRRNSLSSINSDQLALTTHAQMQPWSSPYSHNGSNTNLTSYPYHPQQHYPATSSYNFY
ncbi:uncharacterized protein BX663DRAFT_526612 [Cokeromyces recurvatus]|uniref:uncharacterized protein n=1 Tax=Cokeromyces recurvatus TaxID=90255 RepID=UPI00221E9232|nr:uncharacterized protein BX663DRAFT_526612 [Cokeromyces recurvatus]KAI7897966.1 hypothetical protein BX663DRAFT_526612 [Cokeromyces recurvatus]